MTDGDARARTLGELLDATARRLSARHTPAYPWAGGLARVLERAAQIGAPQEERFERVETSPEGLATPLPEIGAPASTRARRPAGRVDADEVESTPAPRVRHDEEPREDGRPLPADVRSRLRAVAGPAADAIRVHDDSAADALARAHRADAVTVGRDVHFRAGRYTDRQERTFGLLAHEAVHVMALLKPPPGWRRGTPRGVAEEEAAAQAVERTAGRAAGPPVPPRVPTVPNGAASHAPLPAAPAADKPAAPAAPTAPAGQATPMRASTDRATAPAPQPDLEELRRSLVTDLMRRLRAEFERGA